MSDEILDNVIREKVAAAKRDSYAKYEPDGDGSITEQEALRGINKIRNSIVGLQSINWSEHIYPLVALLDRAGWIGLDYPSNQANFGTILDQRNEAIELMKSSPCATGQSEWRLQMEAFLKRCGEDVDSA